MTLPKGIAVILVYRDGHNFRKTSKMTDYETILNGYRLLNASKREALIYPVNNEKKVHLTPATIKLTVWDESLTLEEFKEYLND